ncbi:hypothetical protein ACFFHM_09470 [Halalkalibacter kiskunsagensis]|uniref:Uncharacterized protein n=1 Tax=Halalkalibacter kiskunsagensis TaxID=1548599 RepID=A0ABV6KBM8_9BACI
MGGIHLTHERYWNVLRGSKRYTELWALGDEGRVELIEILVNHREKVIVKLDKYQKNLELLNTKIDFYKSSIKKDDTDDLYDQFVQIKKNGNEM